MMEGKTLTITENPLRYNHASLECPSCGGFKTLTDSETGETVCPSCGLVLDEKILDEGPEWKAFNFHENDERSRTGLGIMYSLYDKGHSTVFTGNRDSNGRKLDTSTLIVMNRLRKYDTRSKLSGTWRRNLSIAMNALDRLCANLHLSQNVKEQSAITYRKALRMDLIRGRSIEAFVAACVYATCRAHRVPRNLKEITSHSLKDHRDVARAYRVLIEKLDLRPPVDDPMKYVPKVINKLGLSGETEQRATDILRRARSLQGLMGKDPMGIASAAIYMACVDTGKRRTQKEIAETSGTTEVTLRNRLRGLEELFMEST